MAATTMEIISKKHARRSMSQVNRIEQGRRRSRLLPGTRKYSRKRNAKESGLFSTYCESVRVKTRWLNVPTLGNFQYDTHGSTSNRMHLGPSQAEFYIKPISGVRVVKLDT